MSKGFAPPTSDDVGAVGGTAEPGDVSGDKRKKVVPAADTSTTTVSNTDREEKISVIYNRSAAEQTRTDATTGSQHVINKHTIAKKENNKRPNDASTKKEKTGVKVMMPVTNEHKEDEDNKTPNNTNGRQENPTELGAVGGDQSEQEYSISETKTQLAVKRQAEKRNDLHILEPTAGHYNANETLSVGTQAHEVDNEEINIASEGTSDVANGTHTPASGIIDDDSDTTGSKNYKEEPCNCLRRKKKDFLNIHESEVRDFEKHTTYRPTADNDGSRFIKELCRPQSDDSQYQHAICTSLTTNITHMVIEENHNNINVVVATQSHEGFVVVNGTVTETNEEHDQVAEPMHRTETRNDQNAETSDGEDQE